MAEISITHAGKKSLPCLEVTTYLIFTKIKSTASTNYYYLTLYLSNQPPHVVNLQ